MSKFDVWENIATDRGLKYYFTPTVGLKQKAGAGLKGAPGDITAGMKTKAAGSPAVMSGAPPEEGEIAKNPESDDDTEGLIRSIGSDKIRIVHSTWDLSQLPGGKVMALETDKAFAQVSADSDWAFYIQGDEVVHEKYHPAIIEGCHKYKNDLAVQGLLFKYKHFFGTYDYVGDSRKWYAHEVRIIRNNKKITAYRDAQVFRIGKTKLPVAAIETAIYHYGWVKSPEQMRKKQKESSVFWHDDTQMQKIISSPDYYDFSGFDSLEKFTDTHPIVMKERIIQKNWAIDLDISNLPSFLIISFFYQALLTPLNKAWFMLGLALGKVVSPIVLGIIFFGLITPIALIAKLMGRDELKLKRPKKISYWSEPIGSNSDADSFKNQF